MDMAHYFDNTDGSGILATADAEGRVDIAIYETPQVIDEKTIALNMLNRRSFQNLQSNPNAAYMFVEWAEHLQGKRFYLAKVSQKSGKERVKELKAEGRTLPEPNLAGKNFVCFRVENVRPLVGDVD